MNIFVVKIGERFFYDYKNKRIKTAWCLAGAKLFRDYEFDTKFKKILEGKKYKFEKVYLKETEEEKKEESDINSEFSFNLGFGLALNDPRKKEKLISRFKLPHITNLEVINHICKEGYRETGNKFSVEFHGSKGYLSHLEISSEGNKPNGSNRIFLIDYYKKNGILKEVMLNIYYSDENGIRLSTGNDLPRILEDSKYVTFPHDLDL